MAQIARGREEGWATIFVAAITNEVIQIACPDEHSLNTLMILGSKRELKHTRVVSMMVGNTEPCSYDDPGYRWTVEEAAHRLLAESGFAASAGGIRSEMRSMPSPADAIAELSATLA